MVISRKIPHSEDPYLPSLDYFTYLMIVQVGCLSIGLARKPHIKGAADAAKNNSYLYLKETRKNHIIDM